MYALGTSSLEHSASKALYVASESLSRGAGQFRKAMSAVQVEQSPIMVLRRQGGRALLSKGGA